MTLVVGLGKTGLSCVRYFAGSGVPCAIADTRSAPPGLADVERDYPHLQVRLGRFDADWFATFERLIVSPGVAVSEPAVQAARRAGSEVIGDIELFARNARAPVVAITGSNGKSTVTTLVERLLAQLHRRVLSGANLGRPVLELLDQPVPDYYVLELSSFQLETLASLRPAVAAIVNVTPDHMDRYASQRDYVQAKARIYRRARRCIYAQQLHVAGAARTPVRYPLYRRPRVAGSGQACFASRSGHWPARPAQSGKHPGGLCNRRRTRSRRGRRGTRNHRVQRLTASHAVCV
jgi:UDP-N-acetylmuramoylalanine--D-glutamate ligase